MEDPGDSEPKRPKCLRHCAVRSLAFARVFLVVPVTESVFAVTDAHVRRHRRVAARRSVFLPSRSATSWASWKAGVAGCRRVPRNASAASAW